MTQLISPQGSVTTVAEPQVQAMQRLGWKRAPGLLNAVVGAVSVTEEDASNMTHSDMTKPKRDEASTTEKKPAAKRGRPRKSE